MTWPTLLDATYHGVAGMASLVVGVAGLIAITGNAFERAGVKF